VHKDLREWRDSGNHVRIDPLGLRVFYRELGRKDASPAKTLLLLHGFPESSFSFNKVVDGLTERFDRIVLLDLPGYGFSDKPGSEYSYSLVPQADAALQVWQHLNVSGGHVLSHDMGTSVLTEIVARHVNRQLPAWFNSGFQSVTFTNGSMVLELAELRLMQKLLLNRKLGPIVSSISRYSLFKKTIVSANGCPIDEHDILMLWENCIQQDGHAKNHHIIRYLNDRRRYEKTRWLPALKAAAPTLPIHICWGDADQVARVSMAYYLHKNVCPNAQLTIMPDVGHFCQLSNSETWLDSVLAYYT